MAPERHTVGGMSGLNLADLPDPDDHDAAWWHGSPAFQAWWTRLEPCGFDAFPVLGQLGLSERYSFAIPSNEVLAALRALGPLVEVGAGAGYWARLLRDLGADVVATDLELPADNGWLHGARPWTAI